MEKSILKGPIVNPPYKEVYLHEVFKLIAKKYPKRKAIVYKDESGETHDISYEQVDFLSNRLAQVLCKQKCKNLREYVAVSLNPSHNLIIILVAIMKSGMAYLPLNPDYPKGRVEYILRESEPTLVIIENNADRSTFGNQPCITQNELLQASENESEDEFLFSMNEENIAMITYTSGSSGVPKGVKLSHKTLLNNVYLEWRNFPFDPTEESCVFKSIFTFVESLCEIWGTLLKGRKLVVIPRQVTKNPEKFIQILEEYKIQRLFLVPSFLRFILAYLNFEKARKKRLVHLKLWICSGEILTTNLAEDFFNYFDGDDHVLANVYGSTEVINTSIYMIKNREQISEYDKIPIGKPVDNTIVYLVNKDMELMEKGEIGQIIVASKNMSNGYIKDNDNPKFIHNPFSDNPEYSKLYLTGDYAKIINDIIIYKGRMDSQVKVRGKRVDLIEIEKTMVTVCEKAVVLCYKPRELCQELLAFVTCSKNCSTFEIEETLKNILPLYMLPQIFILDSIPLLPNGKTDRQTLLKLYEASNQTYKNESSMFDYSNIPKDQLPKAEVLFRTISSVIGPGVHSKMTIDSNFYELGGNSLNTIVTVTKLHDQGYQINITDFVSAKTLAEVLNKMKAKWDFDGVEDNFRTGKYYIEMFNESHKNDVVDVYTESFYQKGDLDKYLIPCMKKSDYRLFIEKVWSKVIEQNLSFVLKSREDNRILGFAMSFDANDKPDTVTNTNQDVINELAEFIEDPIKKMKMEEGFTRIFDGDTATVRYDLEPAEVVMAMREIEFYTMEIAKEKGFQGIMYCNISPLTQQFGLDVFDFEVLMDYQVNQFIFHDGSRPFAKAPNSQRALCMWKDIRQIKKIK